MRLFATPAIGNPPNSLWRRLSFTTPSIRSDFKELDKVHAASAPAPVGKQSVAGSVLQVSRIISFLFGSAANRGIVFARLIGLVILGGLLLLRIADPVFIQSLRNQSFDFFQRAAPREYKPLPVAIVDIDEKSLADYGQWPWPRTRMAELVDKLTAAGAIVIGFDIIFAEKDRLSPPMIAKDNAGLPASVVAELAAMPSNEDIFAQAIGRSRVVLGETSVRTAAQAGAGKREIPEIAIANKMLDPQAREAEDFLLKFPDLAMNLEVLQSKAAGFGVFTVLPDPDGVFRRVPLVVEVADKKRLALSMEILRVATGGRPAFTQTDRAGVNSIVVGGVVIPTDPNARIWPWFTPSKRERYVSAAAILSGTAPPDAVRNKLVLVGTSAAGLEDYRATPVAEAMPGVEIHAQIIENVMAQQFLTRPNYALGMETMIAGAAGIAIIFLVPMVGAIWAFFMSILFVGAYAAGSSWAYFQEQILIDPTFPIATMLTLFIVMATANYIREEAQKRQIRGAFGQYLSPALVDHLTAHPESLKLGGETRPLSVLFTDVRGFTTISESYKKNPQGLTKLMNRFLTVMSNAILAEGGTIDKYMGDAIMAFWNAPLDEPRHAIRSCRAALAMLAAVDRLNEDRKAELADSTEEVFRPINVGVGINSGECVVGNMGSDMRFDYTALGDTVNLASRLEGQSKPFGLKTVLGANTAEAVMDSMAVMEVDLIRVKGKDEPERIFTLLGDEKVRESDSFAALAAANAEMIQAYRAQEWDASERAAERMEQLGKTLGLDLAHYADVYRHRIIDYRENPPGKDWDAVYVAKDK
jgi:adenylate cyclase